MCNCEEPTPEFCASLTAAIKSKNKGVKVVWGPEGLGKSIAVRKTAKNLKESGIISGHITVCGRELLEGISVIEQLTAAWGVQYAGPSRTYSHLKSRERHTRPRY